jgi:hypothetical protein
MRRIDRWLVTIAILLMTAAVGILLYGPDA